MILSISNLQTLLIKHIILVAFLFQFPSGLVSRRCKWDNIWLEWQIVNQVWVKSLIEVLCGCFHPSLTNRSDWPRESLLSLASHAAALAVQRPSLAVLWGKMRNLGQRSASSPSHTLIKTATCCRDRKRGKISRLCPMKATYNVFMWESWQELKGHHAAAQLNHGRKVAPLYSPSAGFISILTSSQAHPSPHLFDHLCSSPLQLRRHVSADLHTHTHTYTCVLLLCEAHLLSTLHLSFKPVGCSSSFLMLVRNWGSGYEKNSRLKIAFGWKSGQKIAFHLSLQHACFCCLLLWQTQRRKPWAENVHDNWLLVQLEQGTGQMLQSDRGDVSPALLFLSVSLNRRRKALIIQCTLLSFIC